MQVFPFFNTKKYTQKELDAMNKEVSNAVDNSKRVVKVVDIPKHVVKVKEELKKDFIIRHYR